MADKAGRLPRWFAAAAVAMAMLAGWNYESNPLTGQAHSYAQEVAKTSAATYVSLRTLNAFLSFAQEVEVSGNAIFVEGTARPLKGLEPIDDTVERIAGAVFAIMVATGVLSVALGPVSGTGWALVGLAALLWLLFPGRLGGVPRRLGVYGGLLGLALPLETT